MREYGDAWPMAEEKAADAVLAPLVLLVTACGRESFPAWAEGELGRLKQGKISEGLYHWLALPS